MNGKSKPGTMLASKFLRDWRKSAGSWGSAGFLAVCVLITTTYFLAGKLGLALAVVHRSVSPVWPPTGIALAAFLLLGYRIWPAVFVAAFLVNWTTAGAVGASLGIALGNTAEGLVGAYLVTRIAGGLSAFDRPESIFRFALAGMFSSAVSATVGVTSLALGGFAGWADYGSVWVTWWLGAAVGAVTVAPLLVLAFARPLPRWDRAKLLEAVLLATCLVLLGSFVFGETFLPSRYTLQFLCIPLLLWVAFRLGVLEAAMAVAALSGVAIWNVLHSSTFLTARTENESLMVLQVFIGVAAVMTAAVAAVVLEQKQVAHALRGALDVVGRELASDDQAIQDLAGRLINAQEEERSRIGRELHDHISQRLALLAIKLDRLRLHPSLPPTAVDEELAELRHQVDAVTEDVHRLSHNLHSSLLEQLGLVPALNGLIAEFSWQQDINVQFVPSAVPAQIPPDVALCLYRVVQEGLSNIAKHSGAKSARVGLVGTATEIHLTIEDAGAGFDPKSLEGKAGLGVVSMRERLRLVQGTLRIHSAPARGTRIEAWAPLPGPESKIGAERAPQSATFAGASHEKTTDPIGR